MGFINETKLSPNELPNPSPPLPQKIDKINNNKKTPASWSYPQNPQTRLPLRSEFQCLSTLCRSLVSIRRLHGCLYCTFTISGLLGGLQAYWSFDEWLKIKPVLLRRSFFRVLGHDTLLFFAANLKLILTRVGTVFIWKRQVLQKGR